MARREKRTSRGFKKAMEDIRRQAEAESNRKEDRLQSSANKMVSNESLRSDRQSVLDENREMQKQLSNAEKDNCNLRTDLKKAREEIKRKDKMIGSLHYEISSVQKNYDEDTVAWRELYHEHEKAKEDLKRRDEEITSLQQRLHAEIEETEQLRTNIDKLKESSELRSVEERWQREVCHLKEQISRTSEEQEALTKAHKATLDQLNETNSVLKALQVKCDALQADLHQQLAERHESHQRELSEAQTEKTHHRPPARVTASREELSVSLCQSCEEKAQLWKKEKIELEETLTVRQKIWDNKEAELKKEICLLLEENIQLQKLTMKNKERKSFWSCCFPI